MRDTEREDWLAQDYKQLKRLAKGKPTAADKGFPLEYWLDLLNAPCFFGPVLDMELGDLPGFEPLLAKLAATLIVERTLWDRRAPPRFNT